MTYDRKCYALAEHFLADLKNVQDYDIDDLAQTIQQAIEDWLALHEEDDDENS